MKSDLDRLMAGRGFDAIVVTGAAKENHALHYLTNGAMVTHATVIRKRDAPPVLICNPMERDEAAKSGLETVTTADLDLPALIKETGSYFEAELRMLSNAFERYGVRGTVSFYGVSDPGQAFMMLSRLGGMLPGVTVTGETETTIFDEAYATKDADEMAAIKLVAEHTNRVMGETVEFIRGHTVSDGRLIKEGGEPLTVGDVKRFVRARLLVYELEDRRETIFAIGRDAGVPHSRGEDGDQLVLGRSIIFDLFPRTLGGGYFHDMTRTFCLGHAPPEVQAAYEQVMDAFNGVMEAAKVGGKTGDLQDLTCEILERYGHKTPRSHPGTTEGYVHSVGHGLGLQIHSRPRLSSVAQDTIEVGQVFTIEPGLYYPEGGFGVRIEDTVYVAGDDTIRSLTPFPKDLVIPVGDS